MRSYQYAHQIHACKVTTAAVAVAYASRDPITSVRYCLFHFFVSAID